MKTKLIKNIKVGDYVRSYDLEKDEIRSSKVTEIFHHRNVPGSKIIINKQLVATGNHPLYINGKYKAATKARVGDLLIDPDGMEVKVHTLEIKPMEIDVYNIEVEGEHNYFAGNLLNHNKCGKYKGSDVAMESKIESVQSSATSYAKSVGGILEAYYVEQQKAVGIPDETTMAEEFTWQNEDIEGGSETWQPDVGFKKEHGGGSTLWGRAVTDYRQAQDAYQGAIDKAVTKMVAAEDALAASKEEPGIEMDISGEKIATETGAAKRDVESSAALSGFAASGVEDLMQQQLRKTAGAEWDAVTAGTGAQMSRALDDYKALMGGGDDLEFEGQTVENIGTIQQELEVAEENMQSAGYALKDTYGDLETMTEQNQIKLKRDLQSLEAAFYSAVGAGYSSSDVGMYIASQEEISQSIQEGIGEYVTGEASPGFDIHGADYGYSPASGALSQDADISGNLGTGHPGSLNWWGGGKQAGLFWLGGSCLEGNVKVVMGDKNASN